VKDGATPSLNKSAAGTVDQPGQNVAAKSGLNKAILDQGWAEFRRQLKYKLAWAGGVLLGGPPHHTNHADVVGAINVEERGLRLLACGGMARVGRPAKQEPAEATQAVVA
jgi:putative transposase